MERVLVIADAVAPTGFCRVAHSILDRLKSKYEFHHLGINYRGDPHPAGWNIYPAALEGSPFGVNRVASLIERVRPRLVFMINDLWILAKYAPALLPHRPALRCIAYFPVDSDPVEPEIVTPLLGVADHLVTYTRFAAREVQTTIAQARLAQPVLPERRVNIIPHGVDLDRFRPLSTATDARGLGELRRAMRRQLFPDRPELADAFIVLNANRNQPRKRIDLTMEGFSLFAKCKPDNVKLYLHMAREDAGWDLQILARRFGITDRLLVTSNDNRFPNESSARLNLIYNACDVGLNTSCAEGWGLVSFEHAATGAAQIVPRHTNQVELWENAAELLEPRFVATTERVLTNAYFVSPEDVAEALERLYQDQAHRERTAMACFRRATDPAYDWDVLARRWDELFQTALATDCSTHDAEGACNGHYHGLRKPADPSTSSADWGLQAR